MSFYFLRHSSPLPLHSTQLAKRFVGPVRFSHFQSFPSLFLFIHIQPASFFPFSESRFPFSLTSKFSVLLPTVISIHLHLQGPCPGPARTHAHSSIPNNPKRGPAVHSRPSFYLPTHPPTTPNPPSQKSRVLLVSGVRAITEEK
jgi:hypothetical protein